MVRLTTRLASTVAVSILALSLAACSDSSEGETAQAPEKPAAAEPAGATEPASAAATEPAQSATTETETAVTETTPATATEAKIEEAAKPAAVVAPTPDGDVDMAKVLEPGPMKEMAIGDENAPVTIVEYMSMTCPHCARFHEATFQSVIDKYAKTGKVRFIVREFPFDPRAAAAIMLARCAPENQFFPMVDVLFKQQRIWAAAEDARAELLNIARLAGFTQESFEACLTNQKLLDDVNTVRNKAANEFGVESTPTFLINGKRYSGDLSIDQMSAIIDPLL